VLALLRERRYAAGYLCVARYVGDIDRRERAGFASPPQSTPARTPSHRGSSADTLPALREPPAKAMDFQRASDALAHDVLSQPACCGVPPLVHLIRQDAASAVSRLDLQAAAYFAATADNANLLAPQSFMLLVCVRGLRF
jgi:hypothetical protein